MTYATALQAPARYQWDADSRLPGFFPSLGNGPFNCGPTCVTFVASFYKDVRFGTTSTRNLATGNYTPTNIVQQKTMLTKRGVSAYTSQPSVATMAALVGTGKRPIVVGLFMGAVPSSIRGHPFTGMHSVVLRARVIGPGGVKGFLVLDPNFSTATGRTDPTGGKRFYPDSVINSAFYEATVGGRSWALIPTSPKIVKPTLPFCSVIAGARIRADKNGSAKIIGYGPHAKLATSGVKQGGSWTALVNGKWVNGNDWRRVALGGQWGFVIEPFAKLL